MTAAAAESATPLADRVLRDPLAVPQGLDGFLRRVERDARREHARMAALAGRPGAVDAVGASAAELHAFLHDELGSALHRALRRPLRQIAPGSAAARNLEQARRWLVDRAARAAALQAEVDLLRASAGRVHDRFGAELPRATRQALERARVSDPHLARLRRADDAQPLHRRVAAAERDLEALWANVPTGMEGWRPGASWDEEPTLQELLACLELRLGERGRVLQEQGRAGSVRRLAARHVVQLARAAPAGTAAKADVHVAAEQAARLLLRGDAEARPGEDLALWSAVLGGASDAVYDHVRPSAWAPQVPAPDPPPEGGTGATRFVVAIDDDYVLITPALRSSVRVRDRRVAVDRVVECAAFSPEGEADTITLARLDVQPLFEGFSPHPGWYATASNARLRVVAEGADGWIARVVRRGALAKSRTPAWVPEPRGTARFRVLGALSEPAGGEVVHVGRRDAAPQLFCGVQTLRVDLPFADCSIAWLRTADPAAGGDEAVADEAAVFRGIGRRMPHTVLTVIGPGRCPEAEVEGMLYVPPFGARAGESPPMDTWLRASSGAAMLRAVARLWLRINKAGHALGVYHVDALVFRTGWSPPRGLPTAHAIAAAAPYGCALGRHYRRPPADLSHVPLYAGLGGRVLPPAVAEGAVALPETEAQAFALFALDVLAARPLPLSGVTPAVELAAMVPDFQDHFAHPELLSALASALKSSDAAGRVLQWIHLLIRR